MATLPGITRPWEIYLVHHSHVDLGYTEPQRIITRKHADFLAQVLDLCTATDGYSVGEQFKWTCEVAWTVKVFLQRYPERAEEFFARVREGRIEVTALYVNMTDLIGEELLRSSIDYAQGLALEHGFNISTAMNNDVNGWSWGLPAMLDECCVRYFDTGINETRSLSVKPRPRPMYWASPNGARVLLWHGDHYLTGNGLGIGGTNAEERIADFLRRLEADNYPHNAVEVRIHGENNDNAPPAAWLPDFIHEWNERWEYPRLRLATPREWFAEIEANWPVAIPVNCTAWPDWWADGNGTALRESSLVRRAQYDLKTLGALTDAGAKPDAERLADARESAILFGEHTWGAWCSTDEPYGLETQAQWTVKSSHALTAAVEAAVLVVDAAQEIAPPALPELTVNVFNPLAHLRTDVAEFILRDEQLLPVRPPRIMGKIREEMGPEFHLIDMESGAAIPVQRIPHIHSSARRPAQRCRFMAADIPARGWRRFRVVPGALPAVTTTVATADGLENAHFLLTIGDKGIAHLLDKRSGRELVQPGEYQLNQYIYETIADAGGREAYCAWGGLRRDATFNRVTPPVTISHWQQLEYGMSIVLQSGGGEVPALRTEITLYDAIPRVDIHNTLTKYPWDRAEAVYHAFPIAGPAPVVHLDLPGAVMIPGVEQIPGSATDWHSVQRYFAVNGVIIASPDVPLVQVNGINTGLWQPTLPPANGVVMSWAMNNYWFTNFPATQSGAEYRYSIGTIDDFDPAQAAAFADTVAQGLVTVVK